MTIEGLNLLVHRMSRTFSKSPSAAPPVSPLRAFVRDSLPPVPRTPPLTRADFVAGRQKQASKGRQFQERANRAGSPPGRSPSAGGNRSAINSRSVSRQVISKSPRLGGKHDRIHSWNSSDRPDTRVSKFETTASIMSPQSMPTSFSICPRDQPTGSAAKPPSG